MVENIDEWKLVKVSDLEYLHTHVKIVSIDAIQGYEEMPGMRCGYVDSISTHADIALGKIESLLNRN